MTNLRAMTEQTSTIMWVLVDEPTAAVEQAIHIVENRLGSDGDISWVAPVVDPVAE